MQNTLWIVPGLSRVADWLDSMAVTYLTGKKLSSLFSWRFLIHKQRNRLYFSSDRPAHHWATLCAWLHANHNVHQFTSNAMNPALNQARATICERETWQRHRSMALARQAGHRTAYVMEWNSTHSCLKLLLMIFTQSKAFMSSLLTLLLLLHLCL